MNLSIAQSLLKEGLAKAGRVSASRSSLPVLQNVLLKAESGYLYLATTNLEVGILCKFAVDIDEEGAITVPTKTLSDLVNMYPDNEIKMRLDGSTLHLRCGSFKNQIKGIDAIEFPLFPKIEDGKTFDIDAKELGDLIDLVAFAASSDAARPALTGVLVNTDYKMRMVAADGFRMSIMEGPKAEQDIDVIVPANSMAAVSRTIKDGLIEVSISQSHIIFDADDVKVFSLLIAASFPDFQEIIPKDHVTLTVVPSDVLLTACKAANVFARDAAGLVRLAIDTDTITVIGQSSETGSSETEVDAVIEGEPLEIAFNVQFLMEALRAIDGNAVLQTTTGNSPMLVLAQDNPGFKHVMMPMHLGR